MAVALLLKPDFPPIRNFHLPFASALPVVQLLNEPTPIALRHHLGRVHLANRLTTAAPKNHKKSSKKSTVKMGHEDAVYLAKLAEQAERYEGSLLALFSLPLRWIDCADCSCQ